MIVPARRRDALRTHRRWRVPDGVSLLELLCAVVVSAVLATASYSAVTTYDRSRRAVRVAGLLEWEITVARGYAIRSGRPMSLVVDERARSIALRDGPSTWRRISLGDGVRLQVDAITLDVPGDSLLFSPRGLCLNCGRMRPAGLTVRAGGRVARVQVGMLGHPKAVTEELAPNE